MPCINDVIDQINDYEGKIVENHVDCIECAWYNPEIFLAELAFARFTAAINTSTAEELQEYIERIVS